jgi:hypothetical protein
MGDRRTTTTTTATAHDAGNTAATSTEPASSTPPSADTSAELGGSTATFPAGGLVRLAAWWDPDLAFHGFAARSHYVERCWLPVLGPSALLALRWSAEMLAEHPEGLSVRMADLARGLGVGGRSGSAGPAPRALDRLVYFGLARERAGTLMVRTHVPPVPPLLVRRLPAQLRDAHSSWLLRQDEPSGDTGRAPVPPSAITSRSSRG